MAPTSNHPHKKLPGAKGQLIYTETWVCWFGGFANQSCDVLVNNLHQPSYLSRIGIWRDEAPALATFSLLPVLTKVNFMSCLYHITTVHRILRPLHFWRQTIYSTTVWSIGRCWCSPMWYLSSWSCVGHISWEVEVWSACSWQPCLSRRSLQNGMRFILIEW